MSLRHNSHSTVSGHVAAISYKCKINNMADNTKHFVIKSLLEGLRRTRRANDTRQPITREILLKLTRALPNVCRSQYETLLFTAAFSLAYMALLRICEFTVANKGSSMSILQIGSIYIGTNTIRIYFGSSKTDQKCVGTHVDITIDSQNKFCYDNLNAYLTYRPKLSGPFFCHLDGSPLTSYQFNAVFKRALNFIGLKDMYFKSHSFRIGGATSMYKHGYPIDEIKVRGRWRSNAYKTYIRL